MTRLINLTPHDIVIYVTTAAWPATITIPSAGVARLKEHVAPPGTMYVAAPEPTVIGEPPIEVPLSMIMFGIPVGLPQPEAGVTYIVSRAMVDALADRDDLVAPHDVVRDDEGRIIGCRGFSC